MVNKVPRHKNLWGREEEVYVTLNLTKHGVKWSASQTAAFIYGK
jgi:hypothetical protein